MDINLKEYPVTRYQGSKRKILPWIHAALTELDLKYESALDGFGGTASVSYLFKKMGKTVTYNDVLRFNHLIGKAIIENNSVGLSDSQISEILSHTSTSNIVQGLFDDFYYLADENKWIDDVVAGITQTDGINEYQQAIAFYALFQACLIKRPFNLFHRKNLSLRTNDVPRNFGNKTSWEKPFPELFRKFIAEANRLVIDTKKPCLSINQSVFSIDPYQYELAYFDPPYFTENHQETSNYHKCYHFLEGLANYSSWEGMIDNNTQIRKLFDTETSNEFTKKNIDDKLEQLLYKFRKSIIVMSYKEGGMPSIGFLESLLKKLDKKVITTSIHYKYALNHQNGDAKKNREVLIIGI